MLFREVDGDYDLDFHNAPRRQYVVNLTGSVDLEVGDGTRRRLGPGSILLAEDTTGRGHKSQAVAGEAQNVSVHSSRMRQPAPVRPGETVSNS